MTSLTTFAGPYILESAVAILTKNSIIYLFENCPSVKKMCQWHIFSPDKTKLCLVFPQFSEIINKPPKYSGV